MCVRTHSVYGFPVWQQPKAVLENTSGVKERHGHAHNPLEAVLHASEGGASGVLHLVKEFVLSKREDGNQPRSTHKHTCTVIKPGRTSLTHTHTHAHTRV